MIARKGMGIYYLLSWTIVNILILKLLRDHDEKLQYSVREEQFKYLTPLFPFFSNPLFFAPGFFFLNTQ